MATDINLHVHPDATTAFLQRGESMWFLVYTGRPGFSRQMQPITNGEIDGAIPDHVSGEQVVSYIETRLEAAGYEVQRSPAGGHPTWSLTFTGRE